MKKLTAILLAAAAFAACDSHKGWTVEGQVDNAPAASKLAVEAFNAGHWYVLDSVEVAADGSFAFHAAEPAAFPDVYRITLQGKSIHFPIADTQTVTVKADAQAFDTEFALAGTPEAEQLMNIDRRISAAVAANGHYAVLADSNLKAELNQTILNDSTGVIAYYIINKTVGGQPLYSPSNRRDVAMLGATAQKFADLLPDDPRTKYLEQLFVANRKAISAPTVIEAPETGLMDIALYDAKGTERTLRATVDGAPATILSFTAYGLDSSLAYNAILKRLWDKYSGQGLKIYQVSFDPDEVQWRSAAAPLPWVAVHAPQEQAQALMATYNVGALPMTFIINGNGDLVERVIDPSKIETALSKHL